MTYSKIQEAYNWFKENDYEVQFDIVNRCLYITVWSISLCESIDILLSSAEVEYRAELYRYSKK